MERKVKGNDIWAGLGFGYIDQDEPNEFVCMIRCFKCGKENYGPAVSTGCCAKCGYDANKKPQDVSTLGSQESIQDSGD